MKRLIKTLLFSRALYAKLVYYHGNIAHKNGAICQDSYSSHLFEAHGVFHFKIILFDCQV
jgi:hypothetical protein